MRKNEFSLKEERRRRIDRRKPRMILSTDLQRRVVARPSRRGQRPNAFVRMASVFQRRRAARSLPDNRTQVGSCRGHFQLWHRPKPAAMNSRRVIVTARAFTTTAKMVLAANVTAQHPRKGVSAQPIRENAAP